MKNCGITRGMRQSRGHFPLQWKKITFGSHPQSRSLVFVKAFPLTKFATRTVSPAAGAGELLPKVIFWSAFYPHVEAVAVRVYCRDGKAASVAYGWCDHFRTAYGRHVALSCAPQSPSFGSGGKRRGRTTRIRRRTSATAH